MTEPAGDTAAAEGFVLRLGRALHTYGSPAPALEQALVRVSARLGLVGQFFSTPTSLFAAFGVDHAQRTYLSRVQPGDVHLGKLASLDESARLVMHGVLAPADGSDRIEATVAAAEPYRRLSRTLAFAAASGAACRLLGGGGNEVAVASAIGLLIGLLERVAAQRAIAGGFFELAAACLASLVAHAAAARGLRVFVGLAAHGYARWRQRPALVPLVLLLVPGSTGFRSFALLLDQKVVVGVDAAFTMLLTATSLVAGLLLAEMIASRGDRA